MRLHISGHIVDGDHCLGIVIEFVNVKLGLDLHTETDEVHGVETKLFNQIRFGNEIVKTKVFMMVPQDGEDEISLDVTDYMWEGDRDEARTVAG